MQRNGRKNFIRAIEQISKGNQSAADVVAELGTMKDGGILPDSYPEGAEPDDDFLMLSDAKVSDGDAGYKPSIFFDFDTGDFVVNHDGKLKEASGFEAWMQWCQKTLMTQRYAHEGYSTDIGIDYESALKADSREEAESILQREIEEALMADPSERTLYVGNITFEWAADDCLVTVQVQGIDGDIEIQTQFESGVV